MQNNREEREPRDTKGYKLIREAVAFLYFFYLNLMRNINVIYYYNIKITLSVLEQLRN